MGSTDNGRLPKEKFDALTPILVNSGEVRTLGHGNGFKDRVIDWLTEKGVLGNYRNKDKGWGIAFRRKNARNVLGHWAGEGKVALLEHVPKLIERGVFLETTPQNDRLDSHIFAAKATIDGKPYVVGFVVRSDVNGNRYYDHVIILEEEGWANSRIRASETTVGNLPNDPTSVINILKKHLGSK